MALVLGTGPYLWILPSQRPPELGILTSIGLTGKLSPRTEACWQWHRCEQHHRKSVGVLAQSFPPATFLCAVVCVCQQPVYHGEAPMTTHPSTPQEAEALGATGQEPLTCERLPGPG